MQRATGASHPFVDGLFRRPRDGYGEKEKWILRLTAPPRQIGGAPVLYSYSICALTPFIPCWTVEHIRLRGGTVDVSSSSDADKGPPPLRPIERSPLRK